MIERALEVGWWIMVRGLVGTRKRWWGPCVKSILVEIREQVSATSALGTCTDWRGLVCCVGRGLGLVKKITPTTESRPFARCTSALVGTYQRLLGERNVASAFSRPHRELHQ